MKRDLITAFVLFIPILIVQITLVPFISIDYFAPDLILILLVYFTLVQGQMFGTIMGASFGLLFDLASGGLLGVTMFSKTLSGFITGYFYNENKIDTNTRSINFSLIVLLAAFIDSFISGILSGPEEVGVFYLLFERSLFPAIYSAIVSMILIFFLPRRKFG